MKFLLLLALAAPGSFAKSFKGFVKLDQGHELFVDYKPAEAGRPTVVLVNGLVYDLHRWDAYVEALENSGVGILRYCFRGQSFSLLKEARDGEVKPEFFRTGLTYENLGVELSSLIEALHIEGPLSVVGLSYGAAIAADFANAHPERVDNLVLMAPLVVSLDRYDPAGAWIHQGLDAIRFWWGPLWGPRAYDYYYDLIYRHYVMDRRIQPDRIPPELRGIPEIYKESIFHLVRAVRDFDLKTYSFTKGPRLHLILAAEEEAPAMNDQFASWQAWAQSSRSSLTVIEGASHAIPDSAPELAASLTLNMISGEKEFSNESLYLADKAGGLMHCANLSALKQRRCQ